MALLVVTLKAKLPPLLSSHLFTAACSCALLLADAMAVAADSEASNDTNVPAMAGSAYVVKLEYLVDRLHCRLPQEGMARTGCT